MKIAKTNKKIILLFFLIGLSLVVLGIVLSHKYLPKKVVDEPVKDLRGEDRIIAQDDIKEVIEKYISNYKIKEYLSSKNETKITIKDLKEKLNIDISEFEKLKYGCDSEYTTIDFNLDYSNYTFTLKCDAFLMED